MDMNAVVKELDWKYSKLKITFYLFWGLVILAFLGGILFKVIPEFVGNLLLWVATAVFVVHLVFLCSLAKNFKKNPLNWFLGAGILFPVGSIIAFIRMHYFIGDLKYHVLQGNKTSEDGNANLPSK